MAARIFTGDLTLNKVAETFKDQANLANDSVTEAIKNMKDNPDNPALVAELQQSINKWSVIYSINSTVTRSMKDLMMGILQKI